MPELFSLESLLTLVMLIFLQAVLGFDNLLYISIESRRAPPAERSTVRRRGVAIAIILRLVLLFVLLTVVESFREPLFTLDGDWVSGRFSLSTIVFLLGGVFIMWTAMKEITHLLSVHHIDADVDGKGQKSAAEAMFWIVLMNMIFSFDSILSAIAITQTFTLLAIAVVISGLLMFALADHVSEFIERNRMYEVLGLFILLIVGVLLLSDGGDKANLTFFGYEVEAMSKTTFYFTIVVMVLLDLAQGRYKRKLAEQKRREIERMGVAARPTPSADQAGSGSDSTAAAQG